MKEKAMEWLKQKGELYYWLSACGYFEAPAGMKYHGAHKGGLFEHSVAVAEELQNLTDRLGLLWEREESPMIIGLLHDVCKIDDYRMKEDGSIEWNKEAELPGHGEKSLIMLAGLINLTVEEKMCIRYHMGAFTDQKEWPYYSRAVSNWPNVLYTHTADMIASKIRGI